MIYSVYLSRNRSREEVKRFTEGDSDVLPTENLIQNRELLPGTNESVGPTPGKRGCSRVITAGNGLSDLAKGA